MVSPQMQSIKKSCLFKKQLKKKKMIEVELTGSRSEMLQKCPFIPWSDVKMKGNKM